VIHARDLGYTFASGRSGIASIDLEVQTGELLALVGPNGSGKTTLLRLLAGDLKPTRGTLSVNAQTPSSRASQSQIGFASAQPVHFTELTGRENAEFFARAYRAGDDAVHRHLIAFSLFQDGNVPVGEYSFGMQRKLMLVEALAHGPALLLLDEPTIGLDPPAIAAVTSELQDRARAGSTVVMGTNDVHTAMLASRVLFLHRGKKVADAAPGELLRSVAGVARIDVSLASPPERAPVFPSGVTALHAAEGYSVEAADAAALPDVCAALLRAGARIREVRVREPDLADVFRTLTGEALNRDALV
jgi:ABC-2 type transport system ATP-binding protein